MGLKEVLEESAGGRVIVITAGDETSQLSTPGNNVDAVDMLNGATLLFSYLRKQGMSQDDMLDAMARIAEFLSDEE